MRTSGSDICCNTISCSAPTEVIQDLDAAGSNARLQSESTLCYWTFDSYPVLANVTKCHEAIAIAQYILALCHCQQTLRETLRMKDDSVHAWSLVMSSGRFEANQVNKSSDAVFTNLDKVQPSLTRAAA